MGYRQAAINLMEGHGFSSSKAPPYKPNISRVPGYPLFIAFVFYLFGKENYFALAVAQSLVSALTVLFIFLIAREIFTKERNIYMATFVAAICPFTNVYAGVFMTEGLSILFTAILAFFMVKAIKAENKWWDFGVGVVCVLNFYIRNDGMFLVFYYVVLLSTLLLFQMKRSEKVSLKRLAVRIVFVLIGTVLTLAPYSVWSRSKTGSLLAVLSEDSSTYMLGDKRYALYMWLFTWLDDPYLIGPLAWNSANFDKKRPIDLNLIPDYAYILPNEKEGVNKLVERWTEGIKERDSEKRKREIEYVQNGFWQLAQERRRRFFLTYIRFPLRKIYFSLVNSRLDFFPIFHFPTFPISDNLRIRPLKFFGKISLTLLNMFYILSGFLGMVLSLMSKHRILFFPLMLIIANKLSWAMVTCLEIRYTIQCYISFFIFGSLFLGYLYEYSRASKRVRIMRYEA